MPSYYYGASQRANNRLRGKNCGTCIHWRALKNEKIHRCFLKLDNKETQMLEKCPEKVENQPACLGYKARPKQEEGEDGI